MGRNKLPLALFPDRGPSDRFHVSDGGILVPTMEAGRQSYDTNKGSPATINTDEQCFFFLHPYVELLGILSFLHLSYLALADRGHRMGTIYLFTSKLHRVFQHRRVV